MLHNEFAISPDCVDGIPCMAVMEARFGFDKGSLVSSFPKSWFKEVIAQLETTLSGQQLDAAVERLLGIKSSSLIGFQRVYPSTDSWWESLKQSHAANPFHRVVADQTYDMKALRSSIYDLVDDDFTLDAKVKRTSEIIANSAKALLMCAEKVTIFDPYFCLTRKGYQSTLKAIVEKCQKPNVRILIFSESDSKPDWETMTKPALEAFKKSLPESVSLNWYSVDDNGSAFLHQRGLFTGKGGIVYDRGFEEPADLDRKETGMAVHIMKTGELETASKDYNETGQSGLFTVVNSWKSHN